MNASKPEKNTTDLFFENFRIWKKKKQTPLKLFEILDQFMSGTFSAKLIRFEKTGSIDNFSISLGNLKIKFHFCN